MMPQRKRRQQDTLNIHLSKRTRKKRSLEIRNSNEEHQYFKLKNIIGESETHYRIDWENDPITNESFEPTWEPKEYVTEAAIWDWRQSRRRFESSLIAESESEEDHVFSTRPRGRGANRRIIRSCSSSITSEPGKATSGIGLSNTFQIDSEVSETDIETPAIVQTIEAIVQISPLASYFDSEDYPTCREGASTQEDTFTQSDSLLKPVQHPIESQPLSIDSSRLVSDSQRSLEESIIFRPEPTICQDTVVDDPHTQSLADHPYDSLDLDLVPADLTTQPLCSDSKAPHHSCNSAKDFSSYQASSHSQSTLVLQTQPARQTDLLPVFNPLKSEFLAGLERISPDTPNPPSDPRQIPDSASGSTESPKSNFATSTSYFQNTSCCSINKGPQSFQSNSRSTLLHTNVNSVLRLRDPNLPSEKGSNPERDIPDSEESETSYLERNISSNETSACSIVSASRFQCHTRLNRRMSRTPQYTTESATGSGPRQLAAAMSHTALPMQDRVRDIRAMPVPGNINAVKANMEVGSPYDSRSPSLVPEPPAPKPVGDARLEVQPIDVARPDQTTQIYTQGAVDHDSQASSKQSQDYSDIEELKDLGLGPMEFAVSLSMPTRVRDQYNSTVQFFNKHVKSFLSGNTDQATLDSMRRLITRLNNVSTHIDLEDDTTQTQREHEVPAEDEANWAVSSSSKFQFLKHLFLHLQYHDKHVAIVAKANRLLDILERFMIGCNFNYYREDNGHSYNEGEGSLKVTLVPSGPYLPTKASRYANIVVAFDASFRSDSANVISLRAGNGQLSHESQLAPVVRLFVYCSAEHIQKCVADGLPMIETDLDRLKATIACISRTRSEVGVLQDSESKPDAAAEEVASFVQQGGVKSQWSLPDVQPVKLSGVEIVPPQNDNTRPKIAGLQDPLNMPGSPASRKRVLDDVPMEDSPKRTRMSPGNDDSHISDSIVASQNAQIAELSRRLSELGQADERAQATARENQVHSARILELEAALVTKEKALEDQHDELSKLQTRYENRSRAFHSLKHEKGVLEDSKAKSEQRYETLFTNHNKLREEKQAVDEELRDARERLSNSTVPGAAELEKAESKARNATEENQSLKRKLESKTSEAEFAREQYQNASMKASELGSRVAQLEARLVEQKRLAEAARLQQDNTRTETRLHLQNLEKSKLEAEELREQLRRRERGRGMTTRTTSVAPRSPRLGASPVRSRAGSRAPGSRPNSPPRGLFGTSGRRPRGMVEQTL